MQVCEKSNEMLVLNAIRSIYANESDVALVKANAESLDVESLCFSHTDSMAGYKFSNAADLYNDDGEQFAILLIKSHINGYVSAETSNSQRFIHYSWLFENASDELNRSFVECLITLRCHHIIDELRDRLEDMCLSNWSKEDYRDRLQVTAKLVLDDMLLKLASDDSGCRSIALKFIDEGETHYGKTVGEYLEDARMDAASYFEQADLAVALRLEYAETAKVKALVETVSSLDTLFEIQATEVSHRFSTKETIEIIQAESKRKAKTLRFIEGKENLSLAF